MQRPERFSWLRRDGAPLAVSLVLHVIAALLIAPWLVMRTIPAQQIEVEVLLEPAETTRQRVKTDRQARRHAATRPQPSPAKPVPIRTVEVKMEEETPPDETRQALIPDDSAGSGRAGSGVPSLQEAAGLSGAQASAAAARTTPADETAGVTALGKTPTQPSPLAPSAGSTPQPSARSVAPTARPGEDRQEGQLNLAGPAPQARSLEPEFRQAARLGGSESLRGGSRAPEDGLAAQTGSVDQTALSRAMAVPPSAPGSSGRGPALAAVAPGTVGQRSVVAGEGVSPVAGKATEPSLGRSALPTSRTPSGGGLSTTGQGLGSTGTVPPGERGAGLVAAATPGMAGPIPGAAGSTRQGSGPGSGERGESRAALLAGTGTAGRDTGTLQTASGSGSALAAVDGGKGQLSYAPDTQARAEALREDRQVAMQTQQPTGQAKVVEERFSTTALKVDSPTTICHLPLLLAGFDRKPIPKGLDTINASEPRVGETPPRHMPSNKTPGYPLVALAQRAEGRSLVRAEIRPDGLVGQLWIKQSSGFQTLDYAAIETVRSWRFYPAQRHGMAVAMWLDVPIEYKVPQQGVNR